MVGPTLLALPFYNILLQNEHLKHAFGNLQKDLMLHP